MGKDKYSKVMGFSNILGGTEFHTIPKIWEKLISIVREKYGKTQTFQIYGFLKYFGWSRNPYNHQNMGKVNFHNTGKVWEKNKHPKVMGFSNILGEAQIHTTPKIWEKWNPIVRKKYEKTQTCRSWVFLKFFTWSRNPCSSQNMGKVNFHYTGKVWENTNISNLWVS